MLDITDETDTQTVDVPARMLKEGKQRINFQLTGRGRYTYQAVLGGFVAADKLKNTTKNWLRAPASTSRPPWSSTARKSPAASTCCKAAISMFRNPLTQLPVGKRGHVELEHLARQPAGQHARGAARVPRRHRAVAQRRHRDRKLDHRRLRAVRARRRRRSRSTSAAASTCGSIHFDVHGYLPGEYKAPPTIIRNAYRPDQLAVSRAEEPHGAARSAPRARTSTASRRASCTSSASGSSPRTTSRRPVTHLAELLAKWNVNPDVYKDTARMLLDVHLATGPAGEVVRYFEIIKEKWPDLEIPFEKIMKVAAAYHDIGEYERSYLVFRATVESSFVNENAVAGFLEAQGEFLRSVDVMNRLLAEYPPEPYVAATTYALAQRVYAKAPQAAADPKLREKKINRVVLVQQALAMLDHFLTMYPEDPAADQAAFSLANALLELKAHKEVIERVTAYAKRYKDSEYLDSYWYIQAYGHFALGEHEKALEMARKVAEHKRTEKQTGREVESPNKWQAIYIMGQVFHSLGKAAEAIVEYVKVEDRFNDAKEAIALLHAQGDRAAGGHHRSARRAGARWS